ncbi:DNA helicase B isoform X2 [Mustelus asterias]
MSRQRAARGKPMVVKGYILPLKDKVQHGSDTEEEEEEPQFLDLRDMMSVSDGASSIKASSVARKFVIIEDLDSSGNYKVCGRFHFTAPWWTVTAKIKCVKGKWYLQHYPSYSLRSCLGDQSKQIISLFLTRCDIHPQHTKSFIDYLPENSILEFSNLLPTLQRIIDKGDAAGCFAKDIIAAINSSDEGQYMQHALKFPDLMKYLSVLLPRNFLHILMPKEENGRKPIAHDTLAELDEMIQTEVWKLGFRLILSRELGLVGCEATLLAFEEADLLSKIPELQRHALVIYDQLKQTCWSKGHTYVIVDELTNLRSSEFRIESAWESLKFLKDQEIIVMEKRRVYLTNFYNYEKDIAFRIKELEGKPSLCIPVAEVQREAFTLVQRERLAENAEYRKVIDWDPGQLRAVAMMCANPVTVISGKGGCGKTTLVSHVFQAVVEKMESADNEEVLQACQDLERDECAPEIWNIPASKLDSDVRKPTVLFTAPTGKAASLLKKKTQFAAYTLHQVIWNFWTTKKAKSPSTPLDWMFSDVQVLIIDEGSLVSVQVLSTILNLLMKHASLRKLVILGDVNQLPSIEPGNMLSDVYTSLKRIRWSIELETNHRAESQLIIDNAATVAEIGLKSTYKELQYDAVMHISKDTNITIPTDDKKFILVSLPCDSSPTVLQEAIGHLLKEAPGLKDDVTSQFIAFRRRDCALINELCCKEYAAHLTRNEKNKIVFQVGDKVCCTKNGYIRDFAEELEPNVKPKRKLTLDKEKRIRLCNGEIFFIREIKNKSSEYLLLDDNENRQILVNYKDVMRECRLQHAWARTIHTFQGSEADTVVYVVGTAGRQNWQHIYTAVSRGRQRVYVVTSEDHFIRAVTAKSPHRNTRLRELLQEKLLKVGPTSCIEGALSQLQPSQMPLVLPSTLAATNSTQFDSVVPPTQVVGGLVLHQAGAIKKDGSKTDSQKEDSFSEDLAFAQNYSWSPQSLGFDPGECDEARKSPTAACTSSLQTSDETMRDASVGAAGEEATGFVTIEPPSSKRNGNTSDVEKSILKYFKLSLLESPLGCNKFKQLAIDCPAPEGNRIVKQLFEEEK